MTELQWLIQMLTKQKLSTVLKDLFIERIGEVEKILSEKPIILPPPMSMRPYQTAHPTQQAPSTQRILDEMASDPIGTATTVGVTPALPPIRTQRIIGGEVNTGNGTKGPRKF